MPEKDDMSTPVPPHADQRPVPDVGGLTEEQFRELVRLVHVLPGRWFVERREDDLGAVSVLLVQDWDGAETEDGPAFALSRHLRRINLDLRRGGRPEFLGGFGTIRQAVDHVLHVMGQTATGAVPHTARR